MSDDITAAIFGLVGALIGAGTTFFVSYRQQKRDAAAEQVRRQDEVAEAAARRAAAAHAEAEEKRWAAQVAARILQSDSLQAMRRVRAAMRTGRYWSEPFALPYASWFDYREQVARHLEWEPWNDISTWFRFVSSLEAQAEAARSLHPTERRPQLTERGRRQLRRAADRGVRAINALERFIGDSTDTADEDEDEGAPVS